MPQSTSATLSIERKTISYRDTGYFGKAVLDYLRDDEKLKPFYGRRPEIESFEAQLVEKAASFGHRDVLVSALKEQYSKAKLKSTSIEALADEKTFTVTTGHQVCFFTGPLYSFYKIISRILDGYGRPRFRRGQSLLFAQWQNRLGERPRRRSG